MNLAHTALYDQRMRDRWQRRGGANPPKRSGRFTKPGPRPRAASLAEAKKRREFVEKADAAMRQIYQPDLGGLTVSPGWAYVNNANPQTGVYLGSVRADPFRTNPYGIYFDTAETTSGTTISSSNAVYRWGVDYGNTDSSTVTFGTTATDVTSSGIVINPTITFEPFVFQPIDQQTIHQMGSAIDAMGQAARRAGEALNNWTANIQIHVNPGVPEGQIFMVPNHPDQNGWVTVDPFTWTPLDPRQRLRQQMEPQRKPCRADGVSFQNCQPAELTALTLLKRMLDETAWRTYLKYGFVNVNGKSGLQYQIRRGQWHVLVRRSGKRVAELCVGLSARSQMPPTDEVIARMIMAECDEPELWRRANVDIVGQRRFCSNPKNHEHLERLVAAA